MAYEPVYRATCLKQQASTANDSTQSRDGYCFEAALSSPNPSDLSPYYTALGLNLPANSNPTCSACLKQTMQIFAQYAVRKEQPLAGTYLSCAGEIDVGCGAEFADANLKVGSANSGEANGNRGGAKGSAGRARAGGTAVVVGVVVAVVVGSV